MDEWTARWARFRDFWDVEKPSMERHILVEGTRMCFYVTFVLGGLSSLQESERRLDLYVQTNRQIGNARTEWARRTDFKILQFMKNGFRLGLRTSLVTGAVL